MRNNEYHIQVAVVQWLHCQYPRALFTTSPAGLKLPIGAAMKMKRMGYRSGTPDLMIFEPKREWHGLFIELKTDDGVTSDRQHQFRTELIERGYCSIVCFGFDHAVKTIREYLRD